MNEQMIIKLKEIANKDSIHDNVEDGEWINVDDYAAGNIDDAYSLGQKEGEIETARAVLTALGISWW